MSSNAQETPRYPIGHKYMSAGKAPRLCTIIDYHRTYNDTGELVKTRYVATHEFMGQEVTDYDVVQTTIDRAAIVKAKGE